MPKWKLYKKPFLKEIADYAFFGTLSQMGGVLISRLDIIMVSTMLGMGATGIYGIILFLTNVILIPYKSILSISNPIVAESFENNDREEIELVYKKSSILLTITGVLLFLLIWMGFDDVFFFSEDGQDIINNKNIFLFLGIGKLVDMISGNNDAIIRYSKYYRWNLLFLLVAASLNVYLNFTLIQSMGLVGAAVASCITIIVFNVMKFVFLYLKLGLMPLNRNTFFVLIIGLILFFIINATPYLGNPILDLMVKAGLITLVYASLVYKLNISADYNDTLHLVITKLKSFIKL